MYFSVVPPLWGKAEPLKSEPFSTRNNDFLYVLFLAQAFPAHDPLILFMEWLIDCIIQEKFILCRGDLALSTKHPFCFVSSFVCVWEHCMVRCLGGQLPSLYLRFTCDFPSIYLRLTFDLPSFCLRFTFHLLSCDLRFTFGLTSFNLRVTFD